MPLHYYALKFMPHILQGLMILRGTGDFHFFAGYQKNEQNTNTTYNECTGTFNQNHSTPPTSYHTNIKNSSKGLDISSSLIGLGSCSAALWYAHKRANKFLQDPTQLHRKDALKFTDIDTLYDQILPQNKKPENSLLQIRNIERELADQTKRCDYIYALGSILKAMPIERIQKEGFVLRQQSQAAKQRLALIEQKIGELFKQSPSHGSTVIQQAQIVEDPIYRECPTKH